MNETRSFTEVVEDLRVTQNHRDELVAENHQLKRDYGLVDAAVGDAARAKSALKNSEAHLQSALGELDAAKARERALVQDVHRLEGQLAKAQRTEALIAEGVLELRAAKS